MYGDFGRLVIESDIDDAVATLLREWMPTYLSQFERERGLAQRTFRRPPEASYVSVIEEAHFLDHWLPVIGVVTARTTEDPEEMTLDYAADWRFTVTAIVKGGDHTETRQIAAAFGGCVRRILHHQPVEVLGQPSEVKWRGGNIEPVADETDEARFLAASMHRFDVLVDKAMTFGDPPTAPDPDADDEDPESPYDPRPSVSGVNITIEGRSPADKEN